MEQEKLTNQKEAIAFLCSKYPKCFFSEGPVKPLKIGIFQEIAADLEALDIISKRLLRVSLRHYTNSWRYLSSVKVGVARIDMLGTPGDLVEEQHAQHAQEQLKESKEKAAKLRETKAKTDKSAPKHKGYTKPNGTTSANGAKHDDNAKSNVKPPAAKRSVKASKPAPKPQVVAIDASHVKVGNAAIVKLGKEPMPVTITDIGKDGISVQLKSGMTVKVKQAQLFSAQKAVVK